MAVSELSSQAMSLRDNEAFQAALDNLRNGASDGLSKVNPDDKNAIIFHQATIKVVDDLRGDLEQFIRSGQPKKAPGIA